MIFRIERAEEPVRKKEKAVGINFESGKSWTTSATGGRDWTALPETD